MNELSNLAPRPGARKERERFGRGPGSGQGKTAGRGQKGQKARTSIIRPGFEGGQTPIIRRVPIRGFNHYDPIRWSIINVVELDEFDAGTVVTPELLAERGIIRTARHPVKVLGDGDLTKKLTVHAHKFSKTAAEKISAKGGKTELLRVGKTEVISG